MTDPTTIKDGWTGDEYKVTAAAMCDRCELSLRQAGEDYCPLCVQDLGGPAKPYSQVDPEDYLA